MHLRVNKPLLNLGEGTLLSYKIAFTNQVLILKNSAVALNNNKTQTKKKKTTTNVWMHILRHVMVKIDVQTPENSGTVPSRSPILPHPRISP